MSVLKIENHLLERYAKATKVRVIISIDEISSNSVLLTSNDLDGIYEKYKNKIAALSTGEILICEPTQEILFAATNRIKKLVKLKLLEIGVHTTPFLRPAISSVIEELFAGSHLTSVIESEIDDDHEPEILEQTDDSDAQKLLYKLCNIAVRAGANDIGITTYKDNTYAEVSFDIKGQQQRQTANATKFTSNQVMSICRLIKNSEARNSGGESKDTFNESYPQDASFYVNTDTAGRPKFRYAHVPHSWGLHVSIRILAGDSRGNIPSLLEQGHNRTNIFLIGEAFKRESGFILFTGPTGSGKSTAMGGALKEVPSTKKIISFEEPVEARLPGVIQVPVNSQIEALDFYALGRTALRLNPNVLIYGELRDADIINTAIRQASTGHLVIGTLHTNSAYMVPQRMADEGISFKRLADPTLLNLIVAQRLIQTVCRKCSMKLHEFVNDNSATQAHHRIYTYFSETNPERVRSIRTKSPFFMECNSCGGTGYEKRIPVTEVIKVSDADRLYIREGDMLGWKIHLLKEGWKSMETVATENVLSGLICPITAEGYLESPYGIKSSHTDYKAIYAQFSENA